MLSEGKRRSDQRGFAAIVFALTILVLLAFAGMAVDVGYLQYQKRRLQAAADAAAMGALRELELGNSDLAGAGLNDASLNGFTAQSSGVAYNGVTVTISNPPAGGSFSGISTAVQASVSKSIPTFFMQSLGQTSAKLTATAVAQTSSTYGSIGGCIFALDATADNALVISGGSTVTTACGVVVNSKSSKAFVISGGSSQLALAPGAQIGVVGPGTTGQGWNISGGATVVNSTTGQSESPVNIQPFSDPLANLTAPTTPVTGGIQGNGLSIDSNHMPAGHQLNPGIYCNGITIQSTNGTLTFNPGTYIIAGGGLTVSSNAIVTGTGVAFYNTRTTASNTWGCSSNNYSAKAVTVQGGNNSLTLSAPTSGSLSGILFFEDRNLPQALSNQITGGSLVSFYGALYFKNGALTFSGGSAGANSYLEIVADTISITGTSNLGNDHSSLENVYTLAPGSTGGGLVY